MGLFPVFLCITNTCSMMSMMARGEVHRPSGVQHDIWNWVTLCTWPDCKMKTGGYMQLWLGSVTNYEVKSAYSTQLQTCLSLTLGLVTLNTRCMKPSCCVAWRTDTLNSPYFCPLLVSPVGQYWWHTSCREERSQIYITQRQYAYIISCEAM